VRYADDLLTTGPLRATRIPSDYIETRKHVMDNLYPLAELVVKITGPLMLVCVAVIYASVAIRTRKAPKPFQALYLYISYNTANRKHAGVMTYLLMVLALFFLAGLAVMVGARLTG